MQTLIQYKTLKKQVEAKHSSNQNHSSTRELNSGSSNGDTQRDDNGHQYPSATRAKRSRPVQLADTGRSLSVISTLTRQRPPSPEETSGDEESDQSANTEKNKSITVKSDDDSNDQANPRNWPLGKRVWTASVIFMLVFSQGWVSACDSNITKPAAAAMHVSETSETLATALFLIGLSLGSLVAGPLSEELGRNPIYLISSAFYLCFTLGAALAPNFGAQIAFRFLSGIFSSPTLSMYGGSLADLFSIEERQKIWPVFALGPLLSPVLAPVAGGWIEDHISWRWVYWIGLILSGAAFLLALLCLPETFSPMILQWRTYHLRQVTGNKNYTCELEGKDSLTTRLRQNLTRPAMFFTTEPIIIALGAYLIVIYVVIFSFFSGFEFVFKDTYGLSSGFTSLAFVGISIGALISTALMPAFNLHHQRMVRKQNLSGLGPPELLLFPAMVASPFFSISLFWLGWTNFASVSYWSGYAATILFGYSMTAIFVSSYIYIIDSYGSWSSSALGSITLARYFVSGGMVVASRPMYQGIGVHWTLTFLGCLGALLVPVPFLLYRYGKVIRKKSKYAEDDGDDNEDEKGEGA